MMQTYIGRESGIGLCTLMVEKSNVPMSNPDFGKDHLREMLSKLEAGEVTSDKGARWWGYLVGALVVGEACSDPTVAALAKMVSREYAFAKDEPVLDLTLIVNVHQLLVAGASLPDDVVGVSKGALDALLTRLANGDAALAEGHFYLGYLQGVLVATGNCTLDELKKINAKSIPREVVHD